MGGEHLLNVLARMSADDLPEAIDHLTESGDLLARSMAYARLYQHDRRPETLARAEADFAAAGGDPADRAEVARMLAILNLEAVAAGGPDAVGRVQRLLAEATDDPADPGSRDMMEIMALLVGTLTENSSPGIGAALARLSSVSVPGDTLYAALVPVLKAASETRLAAIDDPTAAEPLLGRVEELRDDPRVPGKHTQAVDLMGIAATMADAAQRQDAHSAVKAFQQMQDVLDRMPTDDPMFAALSGLLDEHKTQLDAAIAQLRRSL